MTTIPQSATSLSTRHICFLAAVQMDDCLSGRTGQLALSLHNAGCQVTVVEMPSLRAAARRLIARAPQTAPYQIVRLAPQPLRRFVHGGAGGRAWLSHAVRRIMGQVPALEQTTLVVSTPWWQPVVERLRPGLLAYDLIDHLSVFSYRRDQQLMSAWQQSLMAECDLLIAASPALFDAARTTVAPERLSLILNAVPRSWIDLARRPASPPELIRQPGRPIAGFLGALFEWVDLELLAFAAQELPEVDFVLVGPTRVGTDLRTLKSMPNVRIFGAVPFQRVPAWINAFDVALIPFKRDIVSFCADPLKLYEYSAFGKSVVSTIDYASRGSTPAPLFVGEDPAAFVRQIGAACRVTGPCQAGIAFARDHTWDHRARQLLNAVERLAPQYSAT